MTPAPSEPPAWLRLATASGLDRLWRRLRGGRPLVVMYHGVAPDSPAPGKFVSPEALRAQLDGLERHFRVVPLSEIGAFVEGRGTLPRHAAAITFDDAYANLLDHALPELARRGLPATVFASSVGLPRGEGLYWFDEADLRLRARPDGPALREELKGMTRERRERTLASLRETSTLAPEAEAPYRVMGPEGLRRVASMGFEVGGHTASHVLLSREDEAVQREEIVSNFAGIREATGIPPTQFAYPNGKRSDFTEATVRILREAGCRLAVTTEEGFPGRGSDPFRIPRISAGFLGHYGTGDSLRALPLRVDLAARRAR